MTDPFTSFVVTQIGERVLPTQMQPIIPQIPTIIRSVHQVFDDNLDLNNNNCNNNKKTSSFLPAKYHVQRQNMSDILSNAKRKNKRDKKQRMIPEEEVVQIVNNYVIMIKDLQNHIQNLTLMIREANRVIEQYKSANNNSNKN